MPGEEGKYEFADISGDISETYFVDKTAEAGKTYKYRVHAISNKSSDYNSSWDIEAECLAPSFTPGWKQNALGWWYLQADGTYPKNQWELIHGYWYHFDTKGYMQTGWQYISGSWYYFGFGGAMAAGEWCHGWWPNSDGIWTYPHRASWRKNEIG